ncbi:MAG TPA: lipopolysaccharide kinase InaA family protein [Planctomycetota bacterium]|nr:lipopolysaccharide kinase InaA family protein [Planctomycetota bacterium]
MRPPDLPPSLQGSHRLLVRGAVRLLVRRDWEPALPLERLLDGAPPEAWGRSVPHALRGRAAVHVLATPRGEIVAKRLQRGGMLGGVLRGLYGDASRSVREAQAAEELAARGVATPPVIAARATRVMPLLWRLEVATARLPAEGDLLEVLRARGSVPGLPLAVGRTLRSAHDAGLRHRDLQVKNLLVPAGFPGMGGASEPVALVLLDLDRCEVAAPLSEEERLAALARFARSLAKQNVLPAARHVRSFARGYGATGGFLRRLAARAARQVSWHRWAWE